jgi:hypothetical protein
MQREGYGAKVSRLSRVCKKCGASQEAKPLVAADSIRTPFRIKYGIKWAKINVAFVISIVIKYVSNIQIYSYNFVMSCGITLPIIIIIIIIGHQLGRDRPLSLSSNSLIKGVPSRLRPFGLQFSIIFGIILPFILVTCRSRFDLYPLSFSLTVSTFNLSKISSFLSGQKLCILLFFRKFSSQLMSIFFYFFLRVQITIANSAA